MEGIIMQDLSEYSEEGIAQFIGQAIGKPVKDDNGIQVGEILSATRVRNTKWVRLEVVLWDKSQQKHSL